MARYILQRIERLAFAPVKNGYEELYYHLACGHKIDAMHPHKKHNIKNIRGKARCFECVENNEGQSDLALSA